MMYTTYRSIYKVSTTASQPIQKKRLFPLRVRFIMSLIVLLFITCGSIVQALGMDDSQTEIVNGAAVERVLVQPGDTLWGIASSYKPEHTDTRQFIYEIVELNQLKGDILPAGEVLLVPIR
ncbi:LysM peptidoglycan-binding domain-containing protein [Paenibacillus popilliae]|uniref:LysM peptidoglycan-binding domain-containing protein n=1 Tax=Paenibacillus popilliae TaxID=78057 RepID=A0ABY3AWF6_PAEPP|nr:LysM peptidoglycan-binding domain-containing protein [Paenibacillus sp. SDF0028]TQR46726.1 LysM peptidoglycan-binding domain-containing protein [Paenibacillus sp. SDF0028]